MKFVDEKYYIPYKVSAGVSDPLGRLHMLGIATLAQDLAFLHYATSGLSIHQLLQKDLTWVITKQRFVVNEYPLWLDDIILSTWVQKTKGAFSLRDFSYSYAKNGKKSSIKEAFPLKSNVCANTMELSDEKPLVNITSQWMLLNIKTGSPVRLDDSVMGNMKICNEQAVNSPISKINLPESFDIQKTIEPTILDIDANNHVNNTVYIRWILSVLPEQAIKNNLIHTLDTYFVSQAVRNDTLTVCVSAIKNDDKTITCLHSIKKENGSEVFRAKTLWKEEKGLSHAFN